MIKVDKVFADADDTIYQGGNLSMIVIKLLDKEYGYNNIFRKSLDTFLDSSKSWKERVAEIVGVVGEYGVSVFDNTSAVNKLVKSSEVPKEMREVLEKLSPKEMYVFTGSNEKDMCLFIDKLKPLMQDTKIKVFGTNMESSEGKFTGKALEMWDSCKRAEKTRELTKKSEVSIGFGNSLNDINMLKQCTQSYFLTGSATKIYNGCREGPIVYTDLKSLPLEVNNFLNSKREY